MLDFTYVEKTMIDDLKEEYLEHYFLLNQYILPKEVNLIIAYNMILTSPLLKILKRDIRHALKDALHFLIVNASYSGVNLVTEYEKDLNLPNSKYWRMSGRYNSKDKSPITKIIEFIYPMDIFDKLLENYLSIEQMTKEQLKSYLYMQTKYLKMPEKYKLFIH